MEDIVSFLKDKKNLGNLLTLIIIVLALPIGINLARQEQIYQSRATANTTVGANSAVEFVQDGTNVIDQGNGNLVVVKLDGKDHADAVPIRLHSTIQTSSLNKDNNTLASLLNNGIVDKAYAYTGQEVFETKCAPNAVYDGTNFCSADDGTSCTKVADENKPECGSGLFGIDSHTTVVIGRHLFNCSDGGNYLAYSNEGTAGRECGKCGNDPCSGQSTSAGSSTSAAGSSTSAGGSGDFRDSCQQCIYNNIDSSSISFLQANGFHNQALVDKQCSLDAPKCDNIKHTSCPSQCGVSAASSSSTGGGSSSSQVPAITVTSCTPSATTAVIGQTITYTVAASGGSGTLSYTLSGATTTGGSSNNAIPVQFTNAGSKNVTVTVSDGAGNSKSNVQCGSVTVSALATAQYRIVASNSTTRPGELDSATWATYRTDPVSVAIPTNVYLTGTHYFWIEFKANDQTGTVTLAGPIQFSIVDPNPTIATTSCSVDITKSGVSFDITGTHFGSNTGKLFLTQPSSTELTNNVNVWADNHITAVLPNVTAQSGQQYAISLTRSDGSSISGTNTNTQTCTINATQVNITTPLACPNLTTLKNAGQASNIEVYVVENNPGKTPILQTGLTVDSSGHISGFKSPFDSGKPYKISVKLPHGLRRTMAVSSFNQSNFTLNFQPSIPIGDIAPNGGDGTIDLFDLSELKSEWGSVGNTPKLADFNGDGVVNSFDFACLNISLRGAGKYLKDDPIPTPDNSTPNPSTTPTPTPSLSTGH